MIRTGSQPWQQLSASVRRERVRGRSNYGAQPNLRDDE
jgi:hypothetical protein